ncbi:MAG: ADP-ribosylation factor-like protein [Promethearchaeota archaeon]
MLQAIILYSWDNKYGALVDFKYPYYYEVPQQVIIKVYLSHSLDSDEENFGKIGLIEHDNKIYLSFCNENEIINGKYEILLLIFQERYKLKIEKLKSLLVEFGRNTFNKAPHERTLYILSNINSYFETIKEKKILILGHTGSGKTSIKKVVFEGVSPSKLLYEPVPPTRGVEPTVYSWLDLTMGIFDTSGQELATLLSDVNEQPFSFENTDLLLYVMDVNSWSFNQIEMTSELKKINELLKDYCPHAKIIIFLHKIDLVPSGSMVQTLARIKKEIEEKTRINVLLTSIHPRYIHYLHDAFSFLLSSFSPDACYLKSLFDERLENEKDKMCLITNTKLGITVQSLSKNFDFNKVHDIQEIILNLDMVLSDFFSDDKVNFFHLQSKEKMNILCMNLNLQEFGLQFLYLVSREDYNKNLMDFVSDLKKDIYDYFYNYEKMK